MATYTKNLKLEKPEWIDNFNLRVFQDNADKIDEAFKDYNKIYFYIEIPDTKRIKRCTADRGMTFNDWWTSDYNTIPELSFFQTYFSFTTSSNNDVYAYSNPLSGEYIIATTPIENGVIYDKYAVYANAGPI